MDTEDDSVPDCPSSRMNTIPSCDKVLGMAVSSGSLFMFKSSNREDPFFASGWDSLSSLSHTGNFGAPSMVSQNDFGNPSFPVVMGGHYASDSGLVEMVPKPPCFGNFSEIVGSFSLPDCGQISPTSRPPNFNPKNLHNKEGSTENSSRDGMHSEECQISEEGGVGASQNGKRKRMASESQSPFNSNLSAQGDPSGNCSGRLKKNGEKKRNVEQNTSPNLQSKQNAKIDKGNSNSGDGPKENYIHARARRGQATNSHSLAERVRRERISERMRLLQELVPGCNKITGKAVMLDEIINYVQSLQQQVELLSMKLATVNPELNTKVDRILSKEILHTQGGNTPTLGFVAGLNGYQYSQSFPRGSLPGISCTAPPFPMPQVWDSDHQNLLQMGFDSNAAVNNLVHNGCSKLEL